MFHVHIKRILLKSILLITIKITGGDGILNSSNINSSANALAFAFNSNISSKASNSNISSKASNNKNSLQKAIKFRPGTQSDEIPISITMAKNFMNPLSVLNNSKRFIVAESVPDSVSNNGEATAKAEVYGWAQLRPIGPRTRDPDKFDAPPGSGMTKSQSIQSEIEEEIWEDFESDPLDVPIGFASLPWTKEYREYSQKSQDRREKRMQMENGSNDNVNKSNPDDNQLWELASVYVVPEMRRSGIGSELIRRLLAKHIMLERRIEDVYLLTLDNNANSNSNSKTRDWYGSFGFEVTEDPPASMALEIAAGGALTRIMGESLVSMRGSGRGSGRGRTGD